MWRRINELFNYLPLAAIIESKILCMHGGIGRCIHKIDQVGWGRVEMGQAPPQGCGCDPYIERQHEGFPSLQCCNEVDPDVVTPKTPNSSRL